MTRGVTTAEVEVRVLPVSALKITRSRLSLSRGGSAAATTLRPAGDRSVGARLCVLLHSRSPHVPPAGGPLWDEV